MPASRRIPLVWKDELLARDGYACTYCGATYDDRRPHLTTLDHLIPKRHGGPQAKWNLAIACAPCNRRKHAQVTTAALEKLIRNLRRLHAETAAYVRYQRELATIRETP